MKIGMCTGTDINSLGRRATVRCNACARVFMIAASAVGSASCGCAPPSADRLAELRSDQNELDLRRQLREWRPQR